MMRRDFVAGLREAERARAEQELPTAAQLRLREKLEGPKRLRPFFWAMGLGTAVAAGLALLIAYAASSTRAPALPPVVNGFVMAKIDAPVPQARADGAIAALQGPVTLFDRGGRIEIAAAQGAVLKREPEGLRVVEGTATLHVLPRLPEEPPAKILVSHGAIEVLGTRFTIVQEARGGTVTLHDGRIRFTQQDGREVTLAPGDTVSWPLPVVEAPMPVATAIDPPLVADAAPKAAPSRKRPPRAPAVAPAAPTFDVEAFIDELSVLRRRGQFQEAATRIDAALGGSLPPATAERLSYELGSILTWQLKQADRACAVWNAHAQKWPGGRYQAEVLRARTALSCE